MKLCKSCDLTKPFEDFTKHSDSSDGYYRYCRSCKRLRENTAYGPERSKRILARKQERVSRNQKLMMDLLSLCKCADCGEPDPIVLEFDHLGDKLLGVSLLLHQGFSWEKIQREISKCDVVCANCHRRRTYNRVKSYRVKPNAT